LTSQVYHNKLKNRTPSNKKITETEHPTGLDKKDASQNEGASGISAKSECNCFWDLDDL
jgi:hypothetical protein